MDAQTEPANLGGYGYPNNAAQSPGEAAQAYASMLQLAEQARLAAVAESMVPSGTNEASLAQTLREVLREEMATLQQQQTKAAADTEKAVAAHNQDETNLDSARQAFEAERLKESRELDRRGISFAKEAYKKEQAEQEVAVKKELYLHPKPKSRPELRSVGGYKVDGGILEVFTRFRPNATPVSEAREKAEKSSSHDKTEDKPDRKTEDKDVQLPQKDVKEVKKSGLKPREPDHPPRRPFGVNPPPPPVDIHESKKRYWVSMEAYITFFT